MDYFSAIFAVLIISGVAADKKSYEGHSVYKLKPKTNEDVNVLQNVRIQGLGEFWDDQFHIDYEARITVPKENRKRFIDFIDKSTMEPEEIIKDLQRWEIVLVIICWYLATQESVGSIIREEVGT